MNPKYGPIIVFGGIILLGILFGSIALWLEDREEISPMDYRYLSRYEEPELRAMIRDFMKDNKVSHKEYMQVIRRSAKLDEEKVNVDSLKQLIR